MALPLALALGTMAYSAYSANQQAKQNQQAQQQANKTNLQSSREQMDFQEKMSSTAHQREIADLKAAGLNPLLSAHGGASAPSGAMAMSSPAPDTSSSGVSTALREGVNNAFSLQSISKDLQQKDANLALTKMQAEATDAQRDLASSSALKNYNDLNQPERSGDHMELRRSKFAAEAAAKIAEDKLRLKRSQTDSEMHKFDSMNNRIRAGIGTASSAIDMINPLNKWMPRGTDRVIDKSTGEILHESKRR